MRVGVPWVFDVLLGVVGLASRASTVFIVWFCIKATRHMCREAAANPDPRRRRTVRIALLGNLALFVVVAIAFVSGRHFWGTCGGVVLVIWIFVVLWRATILLAARHDLKETQKPGAD